MKISLARTSAPKTSKQYQEVSFNAETDVTRCSDGMLTIGVKSVVPLTSRRLRLLARRIVKDAERNEIKHLALDVRVLQTLDGADGERGDLIRLLAENMLMAAYRYDVYKTCASDKYRGLTSCVLLADATRTEKAQFALATIVADEVNKCRTVCNTPGGDMTPQMLATQIRKAARGSGASVRILQKADITKLKMGALLGVARGAKNPPTFTIVEYRGGKKGAAPVVFVGKGITYDTGGLSLKPSPYMLDMHLDMSGGAAVAHAVIAAARLKLPVNAVALVPAAENALGSESYRPGDVLTSMSGKTIDVLNTDAEGRLVLADGLTYAKRYKPQLVVDVATLTGASLVALGTKCSAVLSPDDERARSICAAGEASGDYCWPLPLWDEYKPLLKGRFADVANIPVKDDRYAGTITAGTFLAEFAETLPWAHIDMAPRMVSDDSDFLAQGATGEPVRLLLRLLEERGTT